MANSSKAIIEFGASFPDFEIHGGLKSSSEPIKVLALLRHFFPDVPAPDDSLAITELFLSANPKFNTFEFEGRIENIWSFELGFADPDSSLATIAIDSLYLWLEYSGKDLAVKIVGKSTIFDISLAITAEKPAAESWVFLAEVGTIDLSKLMTEVITAATGDAILLPGSLSALSVRDLSFLVDTGASKRFEFHGAIDWSIEFNSSERIDIIAALDLASSLTQDATPVRQYSGQIMGEVSFDKIDAEFFRNFVISVAYKFQPGDDSIIFNMQKGSLSLNAELEFGEGQDTVLTVTFPGTTFGDIVNFVVQLVDPEIDEFVFDPPWDILNDIDLSGFALVLNVTKKIATVTLPGSLFPDLPFVEIDSLDFIYASGAVGVTLQGRILGINIPSDAGAWDALSGSPPEVPGQGGSLFDLRYLGLGQHVSFTEQKIRELRTIEQVMTELKATVGPPALAEKNQNPLTYADGLIFNANSGWLIGADFTIIGTFSLSIIFNDPLIYGARITLSGEKAKIFAGLVFEILYRRVRDTIGVYQMELALPTAMRQLEFGAVSVTLPVVALEIFTNSDFKIDFGFPWRGNFTRCFAVQAFPFMGVGGFYFNKLSAATATSTPRVKTGEFTPVLEFGLGLKIGLGKSFDKGVLRAEMSVLVEGVIEGVIAWFNPNDNDEAKKQEYYLIRGGVAIVGRIYGAVDFVVIRVEIEVIARAMVQFVIEVYKPMLLTLSAEVSVRASVKVLFVKVHFSFHLAVRVEFTLPGPKQGETPVWELPQGLSPAALSGDLPGGVAHTAGRLSSLSGLAMASPTRLAPTGARIGETEGRAARSGSSPSWQPVFIGGEDDEKREQLDLYFQPAFTRGSAGIAGVALLFMENAIPLAAARHSEFEAAASQRTTDFDRLARSMLAWSVFSAKQAATKTPLSGIAVALSALRELYDAFAGNQADDEFPFNFENVTGFLATNFKFNITDCRADTSATIFPMLPQLDLVIGKGAGAVTIDFNGDSFKLDMDDLLRYRAHFSELKVSHGSTVETPPGGNGPVTPPVEDSATVASFIFMDYFKLLVRTTLQNAIDFMEDNGQEETTLDVLLSDLNNGGQFSHLAGMTSRFLMHGLRLPPADGADTVPFYSATGQQFPLTVPAAETKLDYAFTLTNPDKLEWITFTDVKDDGGTVPDSATLEYTLKEVDDPTYPKKELVDLIRKLNNIEKPATVLPRQAPDLQQSVLPLYRDVARRFNLSIKADWLGKLDAVQAEEEHYSLLAFPLNLNAYLASKTSGTTLHLKHGRAQGDGKALDLSDKSDHVFATRVDLTIRKVITASGEALPDTFLMAGADESGKDRLEDVWSHIHSEGGNLIATPRLFLLHQPEKSDDGPRADLVNDASAAITLLRTNLSSQSGAQNVAPVSLFSAGLADGANFIKLLWEGGAVATGGYYLHLALSNDSALPESIFTDGLNATLVLLITLDYAPGRPEAELAFPFHNCVRLAGPIDLDNGVTFIESEEKVKVLSVPPGNIGIRLTRNNDSVTIVNGNGEDEVNGNGEDELKNLYHLLGLRLTETPGFHSSAEGLTIGPAEDDPNTAADDDQWIYERVLPVAAFAKTNDIADVAGLPPANLNPYAGIASDAQLKLALTWLDLFGNRIADDADFTQSLDVRYFDPILGVNQWPSVAERYYFTKHESDDSRVVLKVELQFDKRPYAPADGVVNAAIRERISTARATYHQIYYQVHQADVGFAVHTSALPGASKRDFSDAEVGLIRTFVDEIYKYLAGLEAGESPDLPAMQTGVKPGAILLRLELERTAAGGALNYPRDYTFPVTVQLDMTRGQDLVYADIQAAVPETQRKTAFLTPSTVPLPTDEASPANGAADAEIPVNPLHAFATDFRKAFSGLHLATSNERKRHLSDGAIFDPDDPDTPENRPLWAVHFGESGISYNIHEALPFFFSVAPLANTLMSGAVAVHSYASGAGLGKDTEDKKFDAIDMNVLARDFLVAVEDFLDPEMAVPALSLKDETAEAGTRPEDRVRAILALKRTLADAISAQVTHILQQTDDIDISERRNIAARVLRQKLLVNLVEGYDIETIIQYNVDVTLAAAQTWRHPPRLSGQPVVLSAKRTSDPSETLDASKLDFTLSSARIPLDPDTSGYLTFLFDTKSPEKYEDLTLELLFRANELEYEITDVVGVSDYQASSWLSFILPIDSDQDANDPENPNHIGDVAIPIPLRTYPMPPSLVLQQEEIDPDAQEALEHVREWQYEYTYEHIDVAQDDIESSVRYNLEAVPDSTAGGASQPGLREMFGALVDFSVNYQNLTPDLEKLKGGDPQADATRINVALGAFERLVGQVATAWAGWRQPVPAASGEDAHYEIGEFATAFDDRGEATAKEITVTVDARSPMQSFPQVILPGFDLDDKPAVEGVDGPDKSITYSFAQKSPEEAAKDPVYGESSIPDRTLVIPDLDIIEQQSAWSAIWLTRNSDLLAGMKTSPAFIFETPKVRFSNPITPLLLNDKRWDIKTIDLPGCPDPPRTLEQHIECLFRALLPATAAKSYEIRIACRYAFALAVASGDGPDLLSNLPILLGIRFAISAGSEMLSATSALRENLGTTLANWRATNQPDETNGRYVFSVSIYSYSGDDKESVSLPLLKIEHLALFLADIE